MSRIPRSYDHAAFKPLATAWRWPSRRSAGVCIPDYPLWRDFAYEYEHDRLAIDLINGSPLLREWVDAPATTPADLDALVQSDESHWQEESAGRQLLY